MAKVEFTEHALLDIDDIATYIALDSIHYAQLVATKIFARAEILENHPSLGRVVPELNLKSVREVFEGNYRIIYKIVNKELIHIITIHHSSKQLRRVDLKRITKEQ